MRVPIMKSPQIATSRMTPETWKTNPCEGTIVWSPSKSLWISFHFLVSILFAPIHFSLPAVLSAFALTVLTLCLGHTVGLHRLLIHRSFSCPKALERFLVYMGTLVGMGGPFRMIYMHDIRDWAQRHPVCHPFYIHSNPLWKDGVWQLHMDLCLHHPPRFMVEEGTSQDGFYRFLQKTWMLQQVLPALVLFYFGGLPFVVWGTSVRIVVSLVGHWMVGYFAHNSGGCSWHMVGHAVQGYNLPHLGLLTMGECWHNNQHAFPGSAKLGHQPGQVDPGWWLILGLNKLGLAWDIRLPSSFTYSPGRVPLSRDAQWDRNQWLLNPATGHQPMNGPEPAENCKREPGITRPS